MNKLNKILLTIVLLPLLIVNVYASSVPYLWKAGDEKVNVNEPNKAGTAKLEKDGKTVTLFLNNYNGGELELECYGTGQSDMVFIINLEGDNYINSDSEGIDMNETSSKVEFKGTGKLTINAPKPISYEDTKDVKVIDLSPKQDEVKENNEENPTLIASNEEENTKLIAEKDDDKDEDDDDDKNDWLVRGLGILLLISIGVISFLVVKLCAKNKKTA